jgi:hypothetical protein
MVVNVTNAPFRLSTNFRSQQSGLNDDVCRPQLKLQAEVPEDVKFFLNSRLLEMFASV